MRTQSKPKVIVLPAPEGARKGASGWVLDHPLITIGVLALVLRIATIALTNLAFAGRFAQDDFTYISLAQDMAQGNLEGWGLYEYQLWSETATFLQPLRLLFEVFGPVTWIGQTYVALWGTAVAVLVTALALSFLDRWAAWMAGFIIAALPSQVLWSSLILKDAAVWALLAAIALLASKAVRAEVRMLMALGAGVTALLFGLAHLREHSLIVAAWALPPIGLLGNTSTRVARVTAGIGLALVIPAVVGLGLGGWSLVSDPNFAERRARNAQFAQSAIVDEAPTGEETPTADGGGNEEGENEEGENEEGGSVRSGTTETAPEDSVSANLSHLPTGLRVMLLEPVPWREPTSSNMSLARLEGAVWYPLLALAVLGLLRSREYLHAMAFPILAGAGILFGYALAEGNIGTAYRHRGEFVWVVALLAMLGAQSIFRNRRERSAATARSTEPH